MTKCKSDVSNEDVDARRNAKDKWSRTIYVLIRDTRALYIYERFWFILCHSRPDNEVMMTGKIEASANFEVVCKTRATISHFWVLVSVLFKATLSAKFFLCRKTSFHSYCMQGRANYRHKTFVRLALKRRQTWTRKWPIYFWKVGLRFSCRTTWNNRGMTGITCL